MAVTRAVILSATITSSMTSESEGMLHRPRRRRLRFASDWVGVSKRLERLGWRLGWKKNLWVEDSKCASVFWVLRNPTKSVTFPKPPRGNAEVCGRENRPRHSRRYVLPAHRALGAQHRRSPSYGRAKIRSYVKSAFSASPATADDLTHKPPAFPPESGRPRHILHWNRRSAPSRSAAPLTKP